MKTWTVTTVLALTACVVRTKGWVNVKEAYNRHVSSTGHVVSDVLTGDAPIPDITQADCDRACEALAWLESRNDLTPYDRGLRERLREFANTGVKIGMVPYVGTAVIAYRDGINTYDRRDKWNAIADSTHVGSVGEQIRDLDLTVTNKVQVGEIPTSSGFKRTYVYTMVGANGIAYKWKTEKDLWSIDDAMYISSGRIKEHAEYKGRKFTELKNCRAKEVVTA